MQAIVYEKYGTPDVLQLKELATPIPTAEQIRIKIHAVSINGSDKENLIGRPLYTRMSGLRQPNTPILGSDIAGIVDMVGAEHTEFKVGDAVFGELPDYHGGFAEYACTHGRTLALKPDHMSFVEAAAIPQAGVIALNGIQKKGNVQAAQSVLINGAGGSGGQFAIQLAKLAGAEVTGVDHTHKLDFMRELGADYVIDYTQQDFTRSGQRYDFILDLVASRSVWACQRALKPGGRYYFVGGSVAVLFQILLFSSLLNRLTGKNIRFLAVPQNREDLLTITELCQAGQIRPIIDKVYPLTAVPEAFRYMNAGKAKGKLVIAVLSDGN